MNSMHALRASRSWARFKRNIPLLIMFVPVVAFYLIFKYAPMFGYVIAFKQYTFAKGVFGSPWVGWKWFELIVHDPFTLKIIWNTFFLSLLNIIVGFPFPILIALMLNEVRSMLFKKSVQTLVYLPHFFSWVIIGGIFITLFSQESGIVNKLITLFRDEPVPFLYQANTWISIYVGSGVWKEAGFSAIIYLAALTSIDPTLYEAASVDGAGKFRKIWHITLPGIRPTIFLLLILAMGNIMEVGFDHVYVLQNNVVYSSSEVLSTYIYKIGLLGAQFSRSTALGLFESLVGFILVLTANRIAKHFNQNLW
ncbi:ABC transporter permease subunit [Paenibacillus sp. HB172176]|uniref:ABC transporter permease n=1 Tax=Paenibacillus sp. HB172176 TaxID=2493690 RepID=UPI00143A97F8|nr:ABC transporter permease subunit [Paenibacillus sp. HB172176]